MKGRRCRQVTGVVGDLAGRCAQSGRGDHRPGPAGAVWAHSVYPRAKKVLELSLREALQLGHNYIGTEHILLGLIREGEGVAAQVLVKLGAELTRVRQQVIQLLSGYQGKEAAEAGTGGRGESPALRLRPWCSTSSAATSRRRRWKANWTRSSAARRKSSGSCRCSLGAPRTTRC